MHCWPGWPRLAILQRQRRVRPGSVRGRKRRCGWVPHPIRIASLGPGPGQGRLLSRHRRPPGGRWAYWRPGHTRCPAVSGFGGRRRSISPAGRLVRYGGRYGSRRLLHDGSRHGARICRQWRLRACCGALGSARLGRRIYSGHGTGSRLLRARIAFN